MRTQKVFSPQANNFATSQSAEVFIYETRHSCLGWFVYPNLENQQGISLHSHNYCDDIEIVMQGTGYRFYDNSSLVQVPMGTIIANPANSPHSLIAKKGESLLAFGYRCPPEYSGTVLKHSSACTSERKAKEFSIYDQDITHIDNTNCQVWAFHCKDNLQLPASSAPERTVIVLDGTLKIKISKDEYILNAGEILLSEVANENIQCSGSARFLLLAPKLKESF